MIAAESDNLAAVQLLVEAGANLNNQDRHGDTALMKAAHGNNKKIVNVLLKVL